jgi:NADPH-dependent 7-cyano-7-deazaguanine reductase QueF
MSNLGVPCPVVVGVITTASAAHLCPFRDEQDYGTVSVSWTTACGQTVELHALGELIRSVADVRISHEQWTADLASTIAAGVAVDDLTVTSQWSTAGLTVSVSALNPQKAEDQRGED